MLPEHVRGQVLELYREVDEAVAAAGPVCVASGRCCRFKEYGHVLFLSNLEADVLLAEGSPLGAAGDTGLLPFSEGKPLHGPPSTPPGLPYLLLRSLLSRNQPAPE